VGLVRDAAKTSIDYLIAKEYLLEKAGEYFLE
jgi:hypothetical protein